ncbi:MAG: menaquinone biosynthesis protein [Syntrophomonadaceae bacterium]|jgi:chorismate dehydratase|nr:menaquinone biosynthesis protein [Syntrophomonadaceae bacterium]
MRPRVGHIQFLNCFPLYYGLIQHKVLLDVDLLKGTPRELNRMLRENLLDLAPISSIEYARNFRDLVLLPDICVSCDGAVMSILLFSKVPIEELNGRKVALTNTSATSQALLRILLNRKYHLSPEYFESPPELGSMLLEADAALLIGDDALRSNYRLKDRLYVYDLGQEWKDHTGEAMVFAVWVVRREFAQREREQLAGVKQAMIQSMQFSLQNIQDVAAKAAEWEIFTPEFLEEYFHMLRFDFDARQQRGLLAYYREAANIGVLNEVPSLEFVEV